MGSPLRDIRWTLNFTAHHLLGLFISDNGLVRDIPLDLSSRMTGDVGEMADVVRVVGAFDATARRLAGLDTLREIGSMMEARGVRTAWIG